MGFSMIRVPSHGTPNYGTTVTGHIATEKHVKLTLAPMDLLEGKITIDEQQQQQQQSSSLTPTSSSRAMNCQFLMEVCINQKQYQEDSCSMFTWEQQYLNPDEIAPVHFFAIADGHSKRNSGQQQQQLGSSAEEDGGAFGQLVAVRMRDAFEQVLKGFPKDCFEKQAEEVSTALSKQGILVDQALRAEGLGRTSGAAFSFALVSETHVVLGNVGDCCVFYSKFKEEERYKFTHKADMFGVKSLRDAEEGFEQVVKMFDKDPTRKENYLKIKAEMWWFRELERIRLAGAEIGSAKISCGGMMSLAMTRAFGDFDFKSNEQIDGLEGQAVIATPSIKIIKRGSEEREVLGLFTDGVAFEFKADDRLYSASETCDQAMRALNDQWDQPSLLEASQDLHSRARVFGSGDNAGLLLVKFL